MRGWKPRKRLKTEGQASYFLRKKKILLLILVGILVSCVEQEPGPGFPSPETALPLLPPLPAAPATEEISADERRQAIMAVAAQERVIYETDIVKLVATECVRCHISQVGRLKQNGGRHRYVLCTDCHREYHAYNPPKDNFTDIMPQCSWCHPKQHGENRAVVVCLTCHTDPHQPILSVPTPAVLKDKCKICHAEKVTLMASAPSKHQTKRECADCHSKKHGRKPKCFECHESHSPLASLTKTADCLACHPVHTPLIIGYPATQAKEVCAGCHEKPYQDLKKKITKHSVFKCVKCHPKHGMIMPCQNCHGEMVHDKKIHESIEVCGHCHGIAHSVNR